MIMTYWVKKAAAILICVAAIIAVGRLFGGEIMPEYRAAIEADWAREESHANRTISDAEALLALVERSTALRNALTENGDIEPEAEKALDEQIDAARALLDTADPASDAIQTHYLALRWANRTAALANPLVTGTPILFMKGNRFVCQMLHEYLSYYYEKTNRHGGGLYVLEAPGESFATQSLTDGKFPRGVFATPSLSFDAKTLYFAFADFSKVQKEGEPVLSTDEFRNRGYWPDFESEYLKIEEGKYHLFQMDLSNGAFKQLTTGPNDDFDPTALPGGGLAFVSTRRGGYGRCHGGWEPLAVHTLHRLENDGSIDCISWHETNEWQPSVLRDGRIVYTRWDYVDRSASHHHGLWITKPDGTGAVSLFGNYTFQVNACYQAKEIPGSPKIMFVAGAHHLDVGGSLVILDPSKVKYDPTESEDTLDCLECVTPEIPFPETPKQCPDQYYLSPWPLSEEFWLTAYSHDPLGGMLNSAPWSGETGKTGLYYRDRFGNQELLYEDAEFSCQYPQPIASREEPFVVPRRLPPRNQANGLATLNLSNVYESLTTLPADRPIKELHVFQILPKFPDHRSHTPPLGHANAENARLYLGSVPVEADGSAHFTVPADKPLYFQAIDAEGRAVQSMRSEVYLRPGESRGCVGCHEQAQTTLKNTDQQGVAHKRTASSLTPGPDGTAPFSYPRLIQPIWDRACLDCHNSGESAAAPDRRARARCPTRTMSRR